LFDPVKSVFVIINKINLVDHGNNMFDADELQNKAMSARLSKHALTRVNEHHRDISI
jgi:sulfate adenylyltransferase subunit 1 (EFTu-like GTPase family)